MSKRNPRPSDGAAAVVPDLPHLTPKELLFVDGILAGKTGADAYRDAYDASSMAPGSITSEAARLRRNPKVEAWLLAGYVAHLSAGVVTKEEHVRELGAIRELSKQQGDLKSAVAAEHLRGKVSGHYVERSEHTIYDPAALLAQIAVIDRTIAASLAARFNLALPAVADLASAVLDLVPQPPPEPAEPAARTSDD